MLIDHIQRFIIPSAYAILPPAMASDKATAMLLAIGLQESNFSARRQYTRGPAHGLFQFERLGTRGVLSHPRTKDAAAAVIETLVYAVPKATLGRQTLIVFDALTHNDTLACCIARLLLWTLPDALPGPEDVDLAWAQYLAAWRPGKPKPETWRTNYGEAWARVTAGQAS